jgi:hypothetical protein
MKIKNKNNFVNVKMKWKLQNRIFFHLRVLKKREPTFEIENNFWVATFFQNLEVKIFLDSPIIFWAVNYFLEGENIFELANFVLDGENYLWFLQHNRIL